MKKKLLICYALLCVSTLINKPSEHDKLLVHFLYVGNRWQIEELLNFGADPFYEHSKGTPVFISAIYRKSFEKLRPFLQAIKKSGEVERAKPFLFALEARLSVESTGHSKDVLSIIEKSFNFFDSKDEPVLMRPECIGKDISKMTQREREQAIDYYEQRYLDNLSLWEGVEIDINSM